MQTFFQDLQFAARLMRKNPRFALIVVLTVALGIGANTAIFTLVDYVMLRALPVHAPVFVRSPAIQRLPGSAPA